MMGIAGSAYQNTYMIIHTSNCLQVLYTSKNFVACAPTGSGKTVLFELAITRLLMETSEPWKNVKAVYSKHSVSKENQ